MKIRSGWESAVTISPPDARGVPVNPNNSNQVVVVFQGHSRAAFSTDGGQSFGDVSTPFDDAMIAMCSEFPDARIIVLTTYTGDVQVLRRPEDGRSAYLIKEPLYKELLETIHAGRKSLSPEASYELAEHATDDVLTGGEVDVLRLIAAGNANKQIAAQLSITEDTVKGRVKNILFKLGANDRTQAAMIGLKRGIIES